MKLKIQNKKTFTDFLDSFTKVSESFIINVNLNSMHIIASSSDNTIILYGEYECDTSYEGMLCIPNGRKLVSLLNNIQSNSIELTINENNIEYKDSIIRFKYHVLEEDWLRPPSLKIDKIKSFEYDNKYVLSTNKISEIIKSSSFTSESDKIYISVSNGALIGELTDKSKHNMDVYTLKLCDVETDDSVSAILKVDNLRNLNLTSSEVTLGINSKFGIVLFYEKHKKTTLYYILTTQVN